MLNIDDMLCTKMINDIPTNVSRGATPEMISANAVMTWTLGGISGLSTSLIDVVFTK